MEWIFTTEREDDKSQWTVYYLHWMRPADP